MKAVTTEDVNAFLQGSDPMEHIITIECGYMDEQVSIIYLNEKGEKRIKLDDFKPFLWCKHSAAIRMFDGNKNELKKALNSFGIWVKQLDDTQADGSTPDDRILNGYKYMFYAKRRMTYNAFMKFFKDAGVPIYPDKKSNAERTNEYMTVSPVEQYMIQTGRRMFKGYDAYNDLKRLVFDLETQGLNPKIHRIEQIGIRTNKGFEKIISVEGNSKEELRISEIKAIDEFLRILAEQKPDVIIGHNSENFDWDFIIQRCEVLGTSLNILSSTYFKYPIHKKKKDAVLKLGGEVEYYKPTVMWGHSIIDSLHAARRAQAIDSSMKSSNLKYVTKYLNLNKPNRVYVPGDKITSTWNIKEKTFAFNDKNGDWYKIADDKPIQEGYELVSGRYIVERYLLDDLWETDKIEEKLNESNFLVVKMIPTTFQRACTMGTAGIWKLIMLAWSYEHNLVIPALGENKRFVGGLSRLLKTGYVDKIVKLDYNSLYPSVILTWNIKNDVDYTNVLNEFLNYVLSQREKYKELKEDSGKKADSLKESLESCTNDEEKEKVKKEIAYWKGEKSSNDKKQLPLKIFGNSYFGSAGSPGIFPWGNILAAERTTCISRMMLRLMIYHFSNISKTFNLNDNSYNYEPIVGDSFSGDTPLFIKYNETNEIDIKPISELIDENHIEVDVLGREYDGLFKPFKVLCRSGWVSPGYIYRHKTDKPLYEVSEGNMSIVVTEDHSLFNDKREKIKPSEINENTYLEYYTGKIDHNIVDTNIIQIKQMAKMLMNGTIDRIPMAVLNAKRHRVRVFLDMIDGFDYEHASKTCQAGIMFLKNRVDQYEIENKEWVLKEIGNE